MTDIKIGDFVTFLPESWGDIHERKRLWCAKVTNIHTDVIWIEYSDFTTESLKGHQLCLAPHIKEFPRFNSGDSVQVKDWDKMTAHAQQNNRELKDRGSVRICYHDPDDGMYKIEAFKDAPDLTQDWAEPCDIELVGSIQVSADPEKGTNQAFINWLLGEANVNDILEA